MMRQRSEQNGRSGLSFHFVGSPQIGHFMFLVLYGFTLSFIKDTREESRAQLEPLTLGRAPLRSILTPK